MKAIFDNRMFKHLLADAARELRCSERSTELEVVAEQIGADLHDPEDFRVVVALIEEKKVA